MSVFNEMFNTQVSDNLFKSISRIIYCKRRKNKPSNVCSFCPTIECMSIVFNGSQMIFKLFVSTGGIRRTHERPSLFPNLHDVFLENWPQASHRCRISNATDTDKQPYVNRHCHRFNLWRI